MNTRPTVPTLMNREEIKAYLHVKESALKSMIRRGMPRYSISRKVQYFSPYAIERWMKQHKG